LIGNYYISSAGEEMKRVLRRKEQEITDVNEIQAVIDRAVICHLAMCKDNIPYVVPLNFGYREGCLYFHCADEGMKIDFLRSNDLVCFEMETDYRLVYNETPCSWNQYYHSVIGFGRVHFIINRKEKLEALKILLNHYEEGDHEIPDEKVDGVTIIKVVIESITGKKDGN